jgi:hypothetical protein
MKSIVIMAGPLLQRVLDDVVQDDRENYAPDHRPADRVQKKFHVDSLLLEARDENMLAEYSSTVARPRQFRKQFKELQPEAAIRRTLRVGGKPRT